ncbi:dynein intermediate chain 3, ciliary-like isoform X2 [Linepithema humile]
MQTAKKRTKKSGMLDLEGGWPKKINVTDEEAVLRFRRRVEKSANWAPRIKKLTDSMERFIQQNNIINLYENYFDDIVPTALVLSYKIRTSNMYTDPQPVVRPVNHLSWSPEENRLAASYSFAEFKTKPSDVNPCSYIWDIENPVAPVMCLRSPSPLIITEFNPRNPPMLISGLMSGQVCNWDIRVGDRPVQMSHRQFSHRVHWRYDQVVGHQEAEATDRNAGDEPGQSASSGYLRGNRRHGVAIRTDNKQQIPVGTENGLVINVNRKMQSPVEKLAVRFNCHLGPVIAIDRHPFALKNFLTLDCQNLNEQYQGGLLDQYP